MLQLTYGSADGIPGRLAQGWGVLRRAGDHDPRVEEALLEGVTVSLPTTVPKFPSAADLATRPVRLRYAPSRSANTGHWWRSVEAGPDHTQRPGNVFTHAVAASLTPGSRPADFALAPEWLAPFGADQVRDATPTTVFSLPEDPDAHGVAAVLRWLHSAQGPSVHAVPWVVDTVIQALLADTRVILRGLTPDQAWGWIALVNWLLPANAAQSLGFSTHEDAASLAKAFDLGIRVVACPSDARVPTLSHPALEVDVSWPVDIEAAMRAGTWQLEGGAVVPVSAWATAARDLIWLDAASARSALRYRDDIIDTLLSAALGFAEAASLALRLGLLATPGAVIMGRAEALRSVLSDEVLPVGLRRHPQIAPLVAEAGLEPEPAAEVAPTPPAPDPAAPAPDPVDPPDPPDPPDPIDPIDITLVKYTPDLHTHPDLLDGFPFPCPASLLPAATMVARYCTLDTLGDSTLWVGLVLTLPPLGRLAVLHCIAQAPPTPLPDEEVGRLMSGLEDDPHLDRYLSPVLQLLLGVEAHRGQPLFGTGQEPGWLRHLAAFTGGLDAREATYLQLPYLDIVHHADTATADLRRACLQRIRQWSDDPVPTGAWSLRIADGRTLSQLVAQATNPDSPAPRST